MSKNITIGNVTIPLAEIKSIEYVTVEYVYRPAFEEEIVTKMGIFSKKNYIFFSYQPYGEIIDKKSEYDECENRIEKMQIRVTSAVLKTYVPYIKKWYVRLPNGRIEKIYNSNILPILYLNDGSEVEVTDDALYDSLGMQAAPIIRNIKAIKIKAKKAYVFYEDIDVHNSDGIYKEIYKEWKKYKKEHVSKSNKSSKKKKSITNDIIKNANKNFSKMKKLFD